MRIKTLAALCALAAAGAAQAQTADVNVRGKIVPPACDASITTGSDLDWATISHGSLSPTTFTILEPKQAVLTVQCADNLQTHMAFWSVDPNASSAIAGLRIPGTSSWNGDNIAYLFGLGMDPITDKKLGNFTMIATTTTYDGTENKTNMGYWGSHSPGNHSNPTAFNLSAGMGQIPAYDFTVLDARSLPAVANTFTVSFDVYPQLNNSTQITNTREVDFEGKAQFYVRYW